MQKFEVWTDRQTDAMTQNYMSMAYIKHESLYHLLTKYAIGL